MRYVFGAEVTDEPLVEVTLSIHINDRGSLGFDNIIYLFIYLFIGGTGV
jgi:hypothetical protein